MRRMMLYALLTAGLLLVSSALAQGRAYGTINFGDSFAEVTEKIVQIEDIFTGYRSITQDKRPPDSIMRWATKHLEITGYRFYLDFAFYDDKRYQMTLRSPRQNASYFDTDVKAARDVLRQVISGAHGAPTLVIPVEFREMQASHIKFSDIWNVNDEGIMYRIGLGEGSSQYYATIVCRMGLA